MPQYVLVSRAAGYCILRTLATTLSTNATSHQPEAIRFHHATPLSEKTEPLPQQQHRDADISLNLLSVPSQRSQAIAAVTAAGVILLLALKVLSPLNGLFYDAAIVIAQGTPARDVILVGLAQRGDVAQSDRTALVAALAAAGAVAVAFTEPVAVPVNAAVPVFAPRVAAQAADGSETGAIVVALAPATYGIHRKQALVFDRDGVALPSLEGAVSGAGPGAPFYVRFDGGFDGIPLLALADVVAGRVPPALVTGRIAVIDLAVPGSVGLTTPVTPDAPVMSAARFHAFALQTLLSGRAVRDLGLPTATGLVVSTALLGAAAYRRVRPRRAIIVVLGVTLAILAAGLAALHWGNVLLPVAELLLLQALLSLFVWQWRESTQDEAQEALRAALDAQVQAVATPVANGDISHAEKLLGLEASLLVHINRAGQLADRTDGLRTLGLAEGGARLVRAALDEGAPVREETADGFVWAVPLLVAGRLRGLWVARPTKAAGQKPTFARLLVEVAGQVAQFLPVSVDDGTVRGNDVADSVAVMRGRMAVLEEVLGLASPGLGVYTALGTEIFATAGMRQLLSDADAPAAPGAVELAAALCGLTEARVAAALRFVITEQTVITLPLATGGLSSGELGSGGPGSGGLATGALATGGPGSGALATGGPGSGGLSTGGLGSGGLGSGGHEYRVLRARWLSSLGGHTGGHLLLQVLDLTDAARAEEAIRTMGTQLDLMVRNDLEAISLAVVLLGRADLPDSQRTRALERMNAAVLRARTRLDATGPYMSAQSGLDADALFPVDLRTVLARTVIGAKRVGLQVDPDVPRTAAAVIATPARLTALVEAIIRYLGGGLSGGPVRIAVAEGTENTTVEFYGAALDLPQARLVEFLDGTRQPDSPDLRLIAAMEPEVRGWGGHLAVQGDAIGRSGFVLTLRKLA